MAGRRHCATTKRNFPHAHDDGEFAFIDKLCDKVQVIHFLGDVFYAAAVVVA